MKKLLVGLLLLISTGASAQTTAFPKEVEKSFREGTAAIEFVWDTLNGPWRTAGGYGFLLDEKKKLVLTAYHVIPYNKGGHKMYFGGVEARFVKAWPEAEMALIELVSIPEGMKPLRLGKPSIHEPVYTKAKGRFPFGQVPNTAPGQIPSLFINAELPFSATVVEIQEALIEDGKEGVRTGARYLVVHGQARSGFSGGPLFNKKGEVVGITVGGDIGGGFGYFSSIENLKRLLQ